MLERLWSRLRDAVLTLPTRAGWGFCAIAALVGGVTLYALATATGVAVPTPSDANPLILALTALLVPALGEELFFRGVLVPKRGESSSSFLWVAGSLLAFVLWHVVEAWTIAQGAHLFTTPQFLACAAVLGATCSVMRYETGSVWPAVIFHAAIVWGWQLWFGGLQLVTVIRAV
jgi:uncharacterized protein